jgi:hypothetical protein
LWRGHKESQGQSRPVHLVNWPVVIKSKELGGLGIRDLEKTNCALMFKWMWQWVQNSQDWWKEATHTHLTTTLDHGKCPTHPGSRQIFGH